MSRLTKRQHQKQHPKHPQHNDHPQSIIPIYNSPTSNTNSSKSDYNKKKMRPNKCLHLKNYLILHHGHNNNNPKMLCKTMTTIMIVGTMLTLCSTLMITLLQTSLALGQGPRDDTNMIITSRLVKEKHSLSFPRTVQIQHQHQLHTHHQSQRHEQAVTKYHNHHHGSSSLPIHTTRRLHRDEIEHNLHQHRKHHIDFFHILPREYHGYPMTSAEDHYINSPECQPMHDWTKTTFPTCNTVHEQPLNEYDHQRPHKNQLLDMGSFRSTYRIYDTERGNNDHGNKYVKPIAMKTLCEVDDGKDRPDDVFLKNHRIDALFYERMTKSPWILDIYAFCGNSGLFEFAGGGSIPKKARHVDKRTLLELAIQVTNSVADLHSIESRGGHSAFVHGDIKPDQFILAEDGKFKLNDFNKGHLMYWNTTSNTETCPYSFKRGRPHSFVSPEEYLNADRNEMSDTYAVGNVIYTLLTDETPFEDYEQEEAQEFVERGRKPELSDDVLRSDDPVDQALIEAMRMCFVYDWKDRYSSIEIRDYLVGELVKLDQK
jgi:hypothetical protein